MKRNTLYFAKIFSEEEAALEEAIASELIDPWRPCEFCDKEFDTIRDKSASLGYKSICYFCGIRRSILGGSFFVRNKVGIATSLHLIYCWALKIPGNIAAFECGVTVQTVSNFYCSLRDACDKFIYDREIVKLGGDGEVVEIDETHISKNKNHVGRILPGQDVWIFGGIERSSGRIFMVRVGDRTTETLSEIISEYIEPGTKIISDCWKSYDYLDEQPNKFNHESVNHSTNFVNPNNGANTQRVERLWRELKALKKFYNSFRMDELDKYVAEFQWRYEFIKSPEMAFDAAIDLIKQIDWS